MEEVEAILVEESPMLKRQRLFREVEALKRQVAIKRAYGLHFYRPHWKQHLFHKSCATGRYGRTGNRFGKSEMGISETIAFCLGHRPWYKYSFDVIDGESIVREVHEGGTGNELITRGIPSHPVKGLLLVVDWDMAKRIFTNRTDDPKTCGKLFKLLPHESIGKVHLSRGGHIDQIEIKRPAEYGGGISTLSIDTIESWKHNKLGGESADWDFIHIDEPCPEPMFKSYARGLMDRNGKFWFTCTPLDEMWINDMFCPPGRNAISDQGDGLLFTLNQSVTRFIITGSIYDNPFRTQAGVESFETTLTREEKACRLYGMPLAMAGAVYKEFIYDLHVLCDVPKGWTDYTMPPLDYTYRVAWDVHQRIPQALLFVATSPSGIAFVYDELYLDPLIQVNIDTLKKKMTRTVIKDGVARTVTLDFQDQLIDPFSCVPDPRDGSCILDDIMESGLYFQKASKDLTLGVSRVRERLLERTPSALPTICFAPHLTQTLFEFSHYVYDTEKNEPKDQDNHMMENLYRLVLNGLDYIAPVSDEDFKYRRPLVIDSFEVRNSEFSPRDLAL